MTDIVDRLRKASVYEEYKANLSNLGDEAADEIEKLRAALQTITDHFASVMDGPMIRGAGVQFRNGVDSIPTIARARALLKEVD